MRIDKYLANLGILSRKNCKQEIKNGNLLLNGKKVEKETQKINFGDEIIFDGKKIIYKENVFLILNKKENYTSSSVSEANHKSVYDLLENCIYKNILKIVGRLDLDTSGLLLFTNNGQIIHKLIHPKKNIFKKYYVKVKNNLCQEDLKKLKNGIIIDGDYLTKEAKIEVLSKNEINLSIKEGKFHQIKKMLFSIGNEVEKLHRIEIGEIKLGDLKPGEWRFLEKNEVKYLENL